MTTHISIVDDYTAVNSAGPVMGIYALYQPAAEQVAPLETAEPVETEPVSDAETEEAAAVEAKVVKANAKREPKTGSTVGTVETK